MISLSIPYASSETPQTIFTSGRISYPSIWIPSNALLIAQTDMTDITLSSTYRQGIIEWYPNVQTYVGRHREEDLTIVQHPTDSNRKAMKITFDGMQEDQNPIRPFFHVFLDEPNTITYGIQEIWVEAKYFFPTDFRNPDTGINRGGWFIWCEPFVEYESHPDLNYPLHNFDANFLIYPHPTEDYNYLYLAFARRGLDNGKNWVEELTTYDWDKQLQLPQGEEFTLRWHVKRHLTNGIFELWLNNEKVVDYTGQTSEGGDMGWRIIPFDHYCDPGAPVTSNYLTYLEVWGR